MIKLIEYKDGVGNFTAKSADIFKVTYIDTKETHLFVKDSDGWDLNNPEESTDVPISSEVTFATDEEIEQAIQSIIDSYEEGGN